MDQAAQEGPCGQHHGRRVEAQAGCGHGARDPPAFDREVVHGGLEEPQVRLTLEAPTNGRTIKDAVGLRAGGSHCRALAGVERAELDARLVGGDCHRAAESVDFAHQVALADAADGRVAGHLAERFQGVGEQQRARAGAGGRQRGLGAGLAATHHDHVESVWKVHQLGFSRKGKCRGREARNSTGNAAPAPLFHVEQR